jgi:hypothetical protein
MNPNLKIKAPNRTLAILSMQMQSAPSTFLTWKAGREKIGSLTTQPNLALAEGPVGSHEN